MTKTLILGAGVTGLAAGISSGFPVYEARPAPGGICSSYHLQGYRFETGGGHWIFGGDPCALAFIERLAPVKLYRRESAVYFSDKNLLVPFPLQYHLSHLGKKIARRAYEEIAAFSGKDSPVLKDWLLDRFGPTLFNLFFGPFHERYTGGLWTRIAPQDDFKTPIRLDQVLQGIEGKVSPAGYNAQFRYPEEGLDALAQRMAQRGHVLYGKEILRLDTSQRVVGFGDGSEEAYDVLLSTLPLCKMTELAGVDAGEPDPYSSVLVLNIGARKGTRCPPHHWLYVPDSRSGFHRVGFYSNVDPSFVPGSDAASRVGIYVEFAYPGGRRPSPEALAETCSATLKELQSWAFIGEVEVADPTWIDVAYTWKVANSSWKPRALSLLESHRIYQVGRYGRWIFQGIADSIRDGLMAGAALRDS